MHNPPPAGEPVLRSRVTLVDYLASLSPVLGALAPVLLAGGLPDDADALFEHLDEDDLAAFVDELGAQVSKVARVVLLSRIRDERLKRSALSL